MSIQFPLTIHWMGGNSSYIKDASGKNIVNGIPSEDAKELVIFANLGYHHSQEEKEPQGASSLE